MKIGYCVSLSQLEVLLAHREKGDRLPLSFVDLSGQEVSRLTREEAETVACRLRAAGLTCKGIHAAFPEEIRLTGPRWSLECLKRYCEKLILRCRLLGCGGIGVGSPGARNLPEDFSKEEADVQMTENLRMMAGLDREMTFFLESINTKETNYIVTAAHALELVERTGRQNVKLVGDIYHFWQSREKPETFSERYWSQTGYLHIADPEGRAFLGLQTSPAFKEYAKAVICMAKKADGIAVEAFTKNIYGELFTCSAALQMWEGEIQKC